MPALPRLASFVRTLFRGTRLDDDLDTELRSYVELLTEEKIQSGLSPEAARRAALLEVGGVEQVKERVRDVRVGVWLETLWQDTRYAVRSLRRQPALVTGALLSLALGIGGATTIVALLDTTVLRPLPYPRSDRLVMTAGPDRWNPGSVSPAWVKTSDIRAFTGLTDVFERSAGFNAASVIVDDADRPTMSLGVDCGFFEVLGVTAELGRTPRPDDCRPDAPAVVVLSNELWTTSFGREPAVIGRTIRLRANNTQDGRPFQRLLKVIGVMPPRVSLWREQVWLPADIAHSPLQYSVVMGRLRDGVTGPQASSRTMALAAALDTDASSPKTTSDKAYPSVARLRTLATGEYETTLAAIAVGGGGLLVLVCLNVATLLMARALARKHELGIRVSLGASRGRLVRQLTVESLLLTGAGGLAGSALAAALTPPLADLLLATRRLAPQADIHITVAVFLATNLTIVLLAGGIFGVVPGLSVLRRHDGRALIHGIRGGTVRDRWRGTLVAAQVAIALPVFCATASLVRHVAALERSAAHYDGDHLLDVYPNDTTLNTPRYGTEAAQRQLWRDIEASLQAVPGVVSVTHTFPPMMSRTAHVTVGDDSREHGTDANVQLRFVGPDYFRTVGLPLTRGRTLSTDDRQAGRRVAVVSRAFAQRFLSDENAVGRSVLVARAPQQWPAITTGHWEVVGVVEDVQLPDDRTGSLNPVPSMYVPDTWYPQAYQDVIVRTAVPAASLQKDIRTALVAIDPDLVSGIWRVGEELDDSRAWPRVLIGGALGFAILAFVLVCVGVYGALSYAVVQRSREIGVRLALGAANRHVFQSVVGRGLAWTLSGLVSGLVLTVWAFSLVRNRVWGLTALDVPVLAAVGFGVLVVAFATAWAPARRAARTDPVLALRSE